MSLARAATTATPIRNPWLPETRTNTHPASPSSPLPIRVIGAVLAGPEAAWQCARRGLAVTLCEMRPLVRTPAHETDLFAELVCSNSLKSDSEDTAPWLLKQEMRRAGSLLMQMAARASVPAGHALAVDRAEFSRLVTEAIVREPLIRVERGEVTSLGLDSAGYDNAGFDGITILATGPLTSDALAAEIQRLGGSARLFFFDSISPIVEADSIDHSKVYRAARYGKGSDDYINCPMTREEYEAFLAALASAEHADGHDWDVVDWKKAPYFEGCLPIEEIARRGPDTLRFGPMKPVGLRNPHTGQLPYAVVQLRQENLRADSYNLVGFQNHLKFGEQARILRMIPGLENARFLRYGQIHRNTYINGPTVRGDTWQTRARPDLCFAGQVSGVEGYVESASSGLLAGRNAAAVARGEAPSPPPRTTAQILSDPIYDGDITSEGTVTQGNTQSVFAGIDPATTVEYRAFLDFHLGGPQGVPGNAAIESAILDIEINSIVPQPLIDTIPIRIDLVSFQPPNLVSSDFDRTSQPALATMTLSPPISQSDFGQHVYVDVTPLMREAQQLGLPDFQVRILEDLGPVTPGLVEINDTTGANRDALAPLLQVTYF